MMVCEIITGHVHRDAVELDVRTLCDGLVESVLCQGRIGMCIYAARGVTGDVTDLRVDLEVVATFGLRVHIEVAAMKRDLRIIKVVVVNQVIDLIDIEGVAVSTVQVLVHHVRYDHRVINVINPVEINDRAAQAIGPEIEIDLDVNVNIDLVIDGVLDLVVETVIDLVVVASGIADLLRLRWPTRYDATNAGFFRLRSPRNYLRDFAPSALPV